MCVLFGIFYFFVQIYFSFPSVYALCFIVKQRIDSGFFLFKAEQMKKAEKKKNWKKFNKLQDFIDLSDDDFV